LNKQELLEKYDTPTLVGWDGFVRLVDVMGDDAAIVQAARVSYGAGTTQVNEDRGLIRYLMRHAHTSPVEMCEIKLHIRAPMHVIRQWIRHRTASVNEYSTRYSEAVDSMEETPIGMWRAQSTDNKQGSTGFVSEFPEGMLPMLPGMTLQEHLSTQETNLHAYLVDVYKQRLALGVAREQARKDLPLSNYTELYWKIDLHNLMHFLRLRLDSHAQLEIREFGEAIVQIVKDWVPETWSAFEDYKLNARNFSAMELAALKTMLQNGMSRQELKEMDSDIRAKFFDDHGLTNKRERLEFWKKLFE